MKKIVRFLFFSFLCFTSCFSVFAKNDDVVIKKIELLEKTDSTIILEDATYSGLKVHFGLKFTKVNDYAKYRLTIQNNGEREYEFTNDSIDFENSDFIDYTSQIENNNQNKVLPGEIVTTIVMVSYSNPVDNSLFQENVYKEDNLLRYSMVPHFDILSNPLTSRHSFIFLIVLFLFVFLFLLNKKINFIRKIHFIFFLFLLILLPFMISSVFASNTIIIVIESHIEIEKNDKYSILKPGPDINSLIHGEVDRFEDYGSGWEDTYNHLISFKRATTMSDEERANAQIISIEEDDSSFVPVYIWFVEGEETFYEQEICAGYVCYDYLFDDAAAERVPITMDVVRAYWWSDADTIYYNPDSSNFFSGLNYLHDYKDINNFDSSKVVNMNAMFYGLGLHYPVESFELGSNFNTSNVTDMGSMFSGISTKSLDVSKLDTSNVTNMRTMFSEVSHIESLDVSHFDTSKVTDMEGMFGLMFSLKSLDVSHFDTSKVTNMEGMFRDCESIKSLDISNFNTSNVTEMSNLFHNMSSLTQLNLGNINTSKVKNFSSMFSQLSSLKQIDLSHIDTSNAVSMNCTFCGSGFTHLDVSSFDTSKVSTFEGAFARLKDLESITFGDFNTSSATYMRDMFNGSSKLKNLDLSFFDTSHVTNMEGMFASMDSLETVNLSSFNTVNVTDMSSMFKNSKKIKTLDLSNFKLNTSCDMNSMFKNTGSDSSNFNLILGSNFNMKSLTRYSLYQSFCNTGKNSTIWNLTNLSAYNDLDSTQKNSATTCSSY